MGKDVELFKAAKTGNNAFLERIFASFLKKGGGGGGGGGHHVFGSGIGSLRSKGANPNIQDESGYTLLHHATLHGQRETVSLLLRCGASTTITDSSGSCALHLAAWKGDLDTVQLLVTQGPSRANVNQQSDSDDTALHLASQYGYSDVVEFLLQRHADPLLANTRGETPLDLASQYGHIDTVHLLISHCPEILRLSHQDFSPLHLAARNGHSLVALSLINAGISVNTVCKRGSALHEAAMCGKLETVQLLLDKGIHLELRDSEGRTVMDILGEYPTDNARKIQRMIEEAHRKSDPLQKPPKNKHVVAIAQTSCDPILEDSSALAFKKGDTILVQRKTTRDIFIGTAHGRTGSFLAQDVVFFKEKDGHLVPTENPRLSSSSSEQSPPVESPKAIDAGKIPMTIPYEEVPGFPVDIKSPDSTTSDGLLSPTAQSGDTSQQSEDGNAIVKRMSRKEKRFQLQKDDGSYSELKPINPQDAKKEYGENLRLNPVGPAFAQSSSTTNTVTVHNTDQAPTVPADQQQFLGSYYVLEVGNFNKTEKQELPSNQEEPPAAYYMLEVKNFEEESLTRPLTERNRPSSSMSQKSYENVELPPPSSSDDKRYSRPQQDYINVDLKPSSRPSYENVQLHSEHDRVPLPSAPIAIPSLPKIVTDSAEVSNQGKPSSVQSHENVELRGSTPASPEQAGSTLPVNIPQSRSGSRSPIAGSYSSRGSSYENVEQAFLQRKGSQSSLKRSESASSNVRSDSMSSTSSRASQEHLEGGKGVSRASQEHLEGGKGVSRASQEHLEGDKGVRRKRREEIYEAVVIGAKSKTLNHKRTRSDPDRSNSISHRRPSRSESFPSRRDSTQDSSADRNSVPVGLNDSHGEGLNLGVPQKERPISCDSQKLIVSENPFAGLVLSASKQLEDSVYVRVNQSESRTAPTTKGQSTPTKTVQSPSSVSPPGFRGRTETIWDDDRVEKEWTQIDTLLQDMSGTIDTTQPTSPVAKEHAPSNQSASSIISSWLRGLSLGGYGSVLETNGFDRLEYYGGGILAMDDLEDIGIKSQEDQYTIMAAANLLPPPPRVKHATSITEWLGLLELSHLQPHFRDYSLQKLSKLWDIELASVVGIELLGYRKRLQYGIAALREAHPEWERQEKRTSLQSIESSSPMDGVSFVKDYRKIRSTASPKSSPRSSRVTMETVAMETSGQPPPVIRQESDVAIRPPHEAQGTIGDVTDRHCHLPSDSWKHPNTSLIKESVNYEAKYLGSVVVVRVHGTQSTEEACLRLRTSTENIQKIPQILLAISWKGVKFVDAHTKTIVSTHAVRDISYCSQDIEDKCVFAYITKDKSGMNYCHVFMAQTKEIADEILMTIGQAFEIAYQKVMKARSKASHRESSPSKASHRESSPSVEKREKLQFRT